MTNPPHSSPLMAVPRPVTALPLKHVPSLSFQDWLSDSGKPDLQSYPKHNHPSHQSTQLPQVNTTASSCNKQLQLPTFSELALPEARIGLHSGPQSKAGPISASPLPPKILCRDSIFDPPRPSSAPPAALQRWPSGPTPTSPRADMAFALVSLAAQPVRPLPEAAVIEQRPVSSSSSEIDLLLAAATFGARAEKRIKRFKCPVDGCLTLAPTSSSLRRHMRSHTNAKPFKCTNPGCPKTFSRKDNANVHSKKHCAYSHMIQPVALQEQQKTREEVENNIKENL